MNSIVAFDSAVSNQLIAKDLKSGGHSFAAMGRKAFALTALAIVDGKPLKGRALKKAHKAYCHKTGLEIGGEAGKSFTTGKLIPVSFKTNAEEDTVFIKAVTQARFDAMHKVPESKVQEVTEQDALAMLAKSKGMSVADLVAALELATAK